MRATLHPISIADLAAAHELIAEYAIECGNTGIGRPAGQWPMYQALEDGGALRTIGAFVAGDLVGFVNVLVSVLPHYGCPIGMTESFFVATEHRESGAGLALLHAAERDAMERGATALLVSAPAGGSLERLLEIAKAYRHSNTVFCRSLT